MVICTIMTENKKYNKIHRTVSLEDLSWLKQQEPCIKELWLDCVMAEGFGDRFVAIETNLSDKSFRKAKKALEGRCFEFEAMLELSAAGRGVITGWKVRNLHGTRNREYWSRE